MKFYEQKKKWSCTCYESFDFNQECKCKRNAQKTLDTEWKKKKKKNVRRARNEKYRSKWKEEKNVFFFKNRTILYDANEKKKRKWKIKHFGTVTHFIQKSKLKKKNISNISISQKS